jgi:hypothetical protein
MSKSKLLQEAIADAKAVKATAMANAKAALEEAFTPRLQSMISAKLQQEMDDEEMEGEEEEDFGAEMDTDVDAEVSDEMGDEELDAPVDETWNEEDEAGEEDYADEMEDEVEAEPEMEDNEDLELEAIIRELEGEMGDEELEESEDYGDDEELEEEYDKSTGIGNGDNKMDQVSSSNVTNDDDLYEEIDINEIIAALREDLDGDGLPSEGPAIDSDTSAGDSVDTGVYEDLQAELDEAYSTIETMKASLNETNLLNAKLLFSNKLFKAYDLNESQKLKVIDNFDRAETLREVKLVYATLAESMKTPAKRRVNESASKPVGTTAPSKKIISEGNSFQARMQKLAGLKK